MSAGSEAYHLAWVIQIGPALEIIAFEAGQVHQDLFGSRLTCQRRDRCQFAFLWVSFLDTGHGFTPQMSSAYSAMVRSLENFPELATFKIALRDQPAGSAYNRHIS